MRYLTKSRFKLGLECPNKLFYTKKKQYANSKLEDPFLESLAQGGFQVEELARLEYPEGILIEGNDGDYEGLVEQTNALIEKENAVIYEAAFKYHNLFIRVDILVKRGHLIELIEVKAKSFDPSNEHIFVGKKGALVNTWKPYLFDVAFQNHVISNCRPDWKISNYLLMADKSKKTKVSGLNQLFRITKNAHNRTGIIKKVDSIAETGGSVLERINIDDIVIDIQNGKHKYLEDLNFIECVEHFSEHYNQDKFFNYPVNYNTCKKCEFNTTKEQDSQGLSSGFKECWSRQKNFTLLDFEKPNTFEIWNFRGGAQLFENDNKFFLEDIAESDLNIKSKPGVISNSQRQWIQVEKSKNFDIEPFVLIKELTEELNSWSYPLHFIDFETSSVALPFHKGRKPYEAVAFQFSHHTIDINGHIKHQSEYCNIEPGVFPNFDFIRALRKSLGNDNGTILKYASHENTILNAIWEQLEDSDEIDKIELQEFIESISHSKQNSSKEWKGERDMVDLRDVVKNYYYNPFTKGSNSIKDVLPACIKSSKMLQEKYSKPIGEIGISSLNFNTEHQWINIEGDCDYNPYNSLPTLFRNWSNEISLNTLSELEGINNGGAALIAYAKLQYTDMTDEERLELKTGLLKYCELDTLAMVMIYEHWRELIQ